MKTMIVIFLMLLLLPAYALADDHVGFSVKALPHGNQIDEGLSYFMLDISEERETTLEIEVFNHEAEAIDVKVESRNASTNGNGLIVYESGKGFFGQTGVQDLIPFNETIKVPAASSVIVELDVRESQSYPNGDLLGGIHFEKVVHEYEESDELSLQNRFGYLVGIHLVTNQSAVSYQLESGEPTFERYEHTPSIVLPIFNRTAKIAEDLKFKVEVFSEEQDEPVIVYTASNVRMAPESTFYLPVTLENSLAEGIYRLKTSVESDRTKENWEFEDQLEITKKSLNEVEIVQNQSVVSGIENINALYIVSLLSVVLLGGILLMRKRRRHT